MRYLKAHVATLAVETRRSSAQSKADSHIHLMTNVTRVDNKESVVSQRLLHHDLKPPTWGHCIHWRPATDESSTTANPRR